MIKISATNHARISLIKCENENVRKDGRCSNTFRDQEALIDIIKENLKHTAPDCVIIVSLMSCVLGTGLAI